MSLMLNIHVTDGIGGLKSSVIASRLKLSDLESVLVFIWYKVLTKGLVSESTPRGDSANQVFEEYDHRH